MRLKQRLQGSKWSKPLKTPNLGKRFVFLASSLARTRGFVGKWMPAGLFFCKAYATLGNIP